MVFSGLAYLQWIDSLLRTGYYLCRDVHAGSCGLKYMYMRVQILVCTAMRLEARDQL